MAVGDGFHVGGCSHKGAKNKTRMDLKFTQRAGGGNVPIFLFY